MFLMFIYLKEGVHLIGKNCEGMYRVYAGSSPARLPKFQGVSPLNYVIDVRDYNLKRLLVKSSKRLGNRKKRGMVVRILPHHKIAMGSVGV